MKPEIFENNLRMTAKKGIQNIVSFPPGKYWTLILISHNSADIGTWS